jgi:hypothetical protein
MSRLFLDMGPMICITKPSKCMKIRSCWSEQKATPDIAITESSKSFLSSCQDDTPKEYGQSEQLPITSYLHAYIPVKIDPLRGSKGISDIPPRRPRFTKMLSYEEYCRRERW